MNAVKSSKSVLIALALSLTLTGCSTLQSAYNSTAETVSGWFKSDDQKDKKK